MKNAAETGACRKKCIKRYGIDIGMYTDIQTVSFVYSSISICRILRAIASIY